MMMRTHLLENMAEKVNGTLRLPHDIALVGEQCGEPNAFWNPAEYNMLCWMYGSDPEKFVRLVTDGELPESRAVGCENEYEMLAYSWSELFAPYEKPE